MIKVEGILSGIFTKRKRLIMGIGGLFILILLVLFNKENILNITYSKTKENSCSVAFQYKDDNNDELWFEYYSKGDNRGFQL